MKNYVYSGECHCGNIKVKLSTLISPEDTQIRACECSFCRKHRAQYISDPEGTLDISIREPENLQKYRFGQKTADFLFCKICGIYIAAMFSDNNRFYGILNLNILDSPEEFTQTVTIVSYEQEDVKSRIERRKKKWTPLTLRNHTKLIT